MKIWVFLLAPFASGCAFNLYQDYTISAEGFNKDETAVVLDAAQRWVGAVPGGLTMTPTETCANQPNSICVYPKALHAGLLLAFTDRRYNIFTGDPPIKIYVDTVDFVWVPQALSHVVQHEIGHALGLSHAGPGTVMYKDSATNAVVQSPAAQDVSCADVAQFGALHGFHATCSERE